VKAAVLLILGEARGMLKPEMAQEKGRGREPPGMVPSFPWFLKSQRWL